MSGVVRRRGWSWREGSEGGGRGRKKAFCAGMMSGSVFCKGECGGCKFIASPRLASLPSTLLSARGFPHAHRHGRLGFWSMIHDLSCPYSFFTLWSRARSIFTSYMNPVEGAMFCRGHACAMSANPSLSRWLTDLSLPLLSESCAGLFPPMVQTILIINVPSLFGPVWAFISPFLPQAISLAVHHAPAFTVGSK